MPALEGVAVKVGRREFVVPPMTVAVWERLVQPLPDSTPDSVAEMVRVLLEDNYPEITVAELKKALPMRDLGGVLARVAKAASEGLEVPTGGSREPVDLDLVYGRLASELGMSHREIGRMRMTEVQRQFRYWSRFPTVRDMVAAYLGIKPENTREPELKTEDDFRRAFLMHGVVARG